MHAFTSEIGINASESTIYRCVKENIKAKKQEQKQAKKSKIFKKYEPGYLHFDVTYLPMIEGVRKYLFVAIDRATRTLFYFLYDNKNAESAADFLKKCINFFSFKIKTILTDKGLEFSNTIFKNKKGLSAKKEHIVAQICREYNIEHRFIPPNHPQTKWFIIFVGK
jgi:transposase-like protein